MSSCYFVFRNGKNESESNKDLKNSDHKSSTELSSEENQSEVTREKDSPLINKSPDKKFVGNAEVNFSSMNKEVNKLLSKKRHSHDKQSKTLNLIPNKALIQPEINTNNKTNSTVFLNDINKLFSMHFPRNSGSSLDLENVIDKKKIIEPKASFNKNEEIKSSEEKKINKENFIILNNPCFIDKLVLEKEQSSIKIEENNNTPNQLNSFKNYEKIKPKINHQTKDIKNLDLKSVIVKPSHEKETLKNLKKTVFKMVRAENSTLNHEISSNVENNIHVSTSQINNSNPFYNKETNKSSNHSNISTNYKTPDTDMKNKNIFNKISGSDKDIRKEISNSNLKKEKEMNRSDQISSKKNSNLKKENFSSNNNINTSPVKTNQKNLSYNYNSNTNIKENSYSVLSQLLLENPLTTNKDNDKSNVKNVLEDYFLNNSRKEFDKDKEKDLISKDKTENKNKINEKMFEKNIEKNLNPKINQTNKNRHRVEKEKKFKLKLSKEDFEIVKKDPLKHKSFKEFYRNSMSERFLEKHIYKSNKKKLKFLKKFVVQKEQHSINKTFYSLYTKKFSKRRITSFTENKINYLSIKLKVSDNEEKTILSSLNLAKNIFKETMDK